MAGHDELGERRFGKKVDRLKALMEASLRPACRGYYGQLVLTDQQVGEIGDVAEVRRAARAAGRALGMVLADAEAGTGALVIDPKGDLITDVLARLPSRAIGSTVVFDPQDAAPPPVINVLAGPHPAFAVDSIVTIFHRCSAPGSTTSTTRRPHTSASPTPRRDPAREALKHHGAVLQERQGGARARHSIGRAGRKRRRLVARCGDVGIHARHPALRRQDRASVKSLHIELLSYAVGTNTRK
ncbi:hypothetical protein [Spongiactinospora sp. 9N601]|uniref:hypothetical protein n=1 Tax=Spongiactinospora sp. 9N601 TaxID=3375149 RepID=UPI0037A92273